MILEGISRKIACVKIFYLQYFIGLLQDNFWDQLCVSDEAWFTLNGHITNRYSAVL